VVPVSKIEVILEALGPAGFKQQWAHDPGQGLRYASLVHSDSGIEIHASESRGDGTGPIVVYFYVEDIDALAARVGVTAEDQSWGTREFWLRDADGNAYRFGMYL
jgi:uncharacterized glyoxalase superfamily protein PhnB